MKLGVGHRATVEPHIDQVELTLHGLARGRNEDDVVDIGAVQVDLVVVGLAVVAWHKALVFVGVAVHETGSHRFFNLVPQLLDRAYAFLLAVLAAPYGQRSAPVARARKVPVVQVLEPLSKTASAYVCGFPAYGLVECNHAVATSGVLDKPAVERIVENGLVGAPAVRIVVHMLLHFEGSARLLHAHAHVHVQVLGLVGGCLVPLAVDGELRVVGILHPAAFILLVEIDIDKVFHKVLVEVLELEVLAGEVDHGACLELLVDHEERGDAGSAGHIGIVGTKRGGNVHNARTVIGGHVVARNDTEAVVVAHDLVIDLVDRFHPGEKLLVAHAHQVAALELGDNLVGDHFVARLVAAQRLVLALGLEIGIDTGLGHEIGGRAAAVGVEALKRHIVDLGAHAQGGVAGQCPRRCGPCDNLDVVPTLVDLAQELLHHLVVVVLDGELGGYRLVLHIAVASRHVQLVAAQAGASGRRIGLNGVALVEQALVVELLEEPPQGLDIAVFVGDIRVLHVDPVTYLASEVFPLLGVFHHLLAAGGIILVDAYFLAYVFLGDAKRLLHAELHRQPVGVPASLAQHLVALHRLVAAYDVLNRASQHVMNAGHSVSTWWTLVENEGGSAVALLDALVEHVLGVPALQHFLVDVGEIEFVVFLKLHKPKNLSAMQALEPPLARP